MNVFFSVYQVASTLLYNQNKCLTLIFATAQRVCNNPQCMHIYKTITCYIWTCSIIFYKVDSLQLFEKKKTFYSIVTWLICQSPIQEPLPGLLPWARYCVPQSHLYHFWSLLITTWKAAIWTGVNNQAILPCPMGNNISGWVFSHQFLKI